jgi:8-oxo-dGTP pyrophosphatase MutT (NUDIX family)
MATKDFPRAFSSFQKRHKPYFTASDIRNGANTYSNYAPVTPRKNMPIYGAIIRSEDGKYLLVQGRKHMKWSFPKGHTKKFETPIDCASREIFEETGCKSLPNPCDVITLKMATYYLFNVRSTFSTITHDNREVCNIGWFTSDEAVKLNLNADTQVYFGVPLKEITV